jgi:glycosyltransferase involved in cell wall biosynthesis
VKVVHVINTLDTGGAERLVVDLTASLRALGHDASIVTLADSRPTSPPQLDADRAALATSLGLTLRDPRIPVRLAAATAGADVVHSHLFPTLYWSAFTRTGHAARVFTEHSTHNRRRSRRALRAAERFAYRRQQHLVAISEGVGTVTTDYLRELGVDTPIDVIENGIDLSRFTASQDDGAVPGTLRLLMVGSLDQRKDPLRALRLVQGLPGVELTLVGDGPLRADVDAAVQRLGDAATVRVLGVRPDVATLMAESDALLVTSRHEGFGLAAAEAIASGLPVVAPRLDGLAATVGDAGLLHAPADDEGARRDIVRLRDDLDLRRRLSVAARAAGQRFDITHTAKAHAALYTSLLSGDPR